MPSEDKYVLEGRVVTMGSQGVIPDGAIYVQDGVIAHVLAVGEATPAGFEDAPRIRSGDSIYPGMIELHNHLSYNAMPLWDVPQRFTNNGQWKNHEDYPRLITKPSQVLGSTQDVAPALVRYVECRSLLGGVTASQGITLMNAGQVKAMYRGLVRNVEQPQDPGLPSAGTRIANPSGSGAAAYLERLKAQTCYLQHLSEGVDQTARGWFLNLQLEGGDWALTDAFCGIHSTALQAEDFQVLAAHGGSMVWSPLSNYLLYGGTVDIRAAKGAGILVGIGCDWAPSGSKNLLGELKVAWLASQELGGVFSAREIVEMATINAAHILKWQDRLGSIEAGKLADLTVLNGRSAEGPEADYMRVIEARETTVTLVVIDGVPRVGQPSLMERLGYAAPEVEEIQMGRSTRWLYLDQATAHSEVQGLSLTVAQDRLRTAMRDLPQLALDLDSAVGAGLLSGGLVVGGTSWRVYMDFEEEPIDLALAARPYADFCQEPMELDGITIADDPAFLRNLVAARNLPEFIKKGLPPLYGTSIPLPESARFLEEEEGQLPAEVLATTADLKTFLRTWGELDPEGRKRIVDQALVLLEQNYVHLPFKRAMHAVDPLQRLRLLRHRLDETPQPDLGPEIAFHDEMVRVFNSLRDLHTSYRLPRPFRGKVAWLPFLVEAFEERGHLRYLVSNVVGQPGPPSFKPGVEVLYWNGTPIERVVAQNADRLAGSNAAARHAQGLSSLTMRPLSHGLPPDEEWVSLRYVDEQGQVCEFAQEWLVFEPGRAAYNVDPEALSDEALATATALGVDPFTDEIQAAKRVLYAGGLAMEESKALAKGQRIATTNLKGGLDTYLPTVFRAKELTEGGVSYGYVRIFTFNVRDDEAFVREFVRLVERLPQNGLIVDVRGNGGGLIYAAERLLQVLTPRRIEPQKAQFINTPVNLQICRNHDPSPRFQGLDLAPWIRSMEQSVQTGAAYSLGYPITEPGLCNDIGQRYYGPVVLITDALCYSATDMFAAGFQDHRIGPVLGTSGNTGAGGANVWSHAVLRELMAVTADPDIVPSPYLPLPHGADLRVAIRRTLRVGANAGVVVEDLGIEPDRVHSMTRRDLLEGNADLICEATELLAARKAHPIQVTFVPQAGALPRATVHTRHVTRLDVLYNGRPWRSFDVHGDVTELDLQEVVGADAGPGRKLELQGYEDGVLVAAFRRDLNEP